MTAESNIDMPIEAVCCSGCRSARTPRERCRCECGGRQHGSGDVPAAGKKVAA